MGEPGRKLGEDGTSAERPHLRALPPPKKPRETITLANQPIATVSGDRTRVHNLRATSAEGMPAIEVLGGLASRDPSGVVLVGHGHDGLAFALEKGRVVAAFGTGERGSLNAWSQVARTQDVQSWSDRRDGAGVALVRSFIERCVLERLWLATEVGSVLSVLRGDVTWVGSTLDAEHAPYLHHLLMDHARESDDTAMLERRLAPLDRLVVPLTAPEQSTQRGHLHAVPSEDECSFAELDDDDEEAAPFEVLRAVWKLCSAHASLDTLANRGMFGRARTLRALDELCKRGCVELAPAPPQPVRLREPPAPEPIDRREFESRYPEPAERNAAVESFMGDVPSWLADLDAAAASRNRDGCRQACASILEAADAVAASALLEAVSNVMRATHVGSDDEMARHIELLQEAYSDAFRALLAVHTG